MATGQVSHPRAAAGTETLRTGNVVAVTDHRAAVMSQALIGCWPVVGGVQPGLARCLYI